MSFRPVAGDFFVTGPKVESEELRRQLLRGYEVDGDIIGVDPGKKVESKFLGRKISARSCGIELEGDDRLV